MRIVGLNSNTVKRLVYSFKLTYIAFKVNLKPGKPLKLPPNNIPLFLFGSKSILAKFLAQFKTKSYKYIKNFD